MELDVFIKNTLSNILKGVTASKAEYLSAGGSVNPSTNKLEHRLPQITKIDFEVALTDDSNHSSNNGIGVAFSVLKGSRENSSENSSQSLTKIRFSIDVILP